MLATSKLPQNCPIDGKNVVGYAPEGVEGRYRLWNAAPEARAGADERDHPPSR